MLGRLPRQSECAIFASNRPKVAAPAAAEAQARVEALIGREAVNAVVLAATFDTVRWQALCIVMAESLGVDQAVIDRATTRAVQSTFKAA
jgi:hypothetical protein